MYLQRIQLFWLETFSDTGWGGLSFDRSQPNGTLCALCRHINSHPEISNKQTKNLIGVLSVCVRAKKKNGLINILGKGMIDGTGTILDFFF